MKYLGTAFEQLAFAIKLTTSAESGRLRVEEIDTPTVVQDGRSVLVLPDRVLSSQDDLILACQNNVTISFGAAAITLNRCREEAGLQLPDPIASVDDQWIALVHQVRCAFAHDISEPRWNITKDRYVRVFEIGTVRADLTSLHGLPFEHAQIGGAEALFLLKDYGLNDCFRDRTAWQASPLL